MLDSSGREGGDAVDRGTPDPPVACDQLASSSNDQGLQGAYFRARNGVIGADYQAKFTKAEAFRTPLLNESLNYVSGRSSTSRNGHLPTKPGNAVLKGGRRHRDSILRISVCGALLGLL